MPATVRTLLVLLMLATAAPATATEAEPPRTGFEQRQGSSWTTRAEELSFLEAVVEGSRRAGITTIGQSVEGRDLHLVRIGHPRPLPRRAASGRRVALFICSQHGDEPAGRETCLQWLRDLAFTGDAGLVDLLRSWTILFIPNANPDGAEAGTRTNADEVDINRDHLNVRTPEGQAMARVIRGWRPDVVLDLHEFYGANPGGDQPFGGSASVVYDDEILYLWPRNLNVDPQIHALSKTLAADYIGTGARAAGFTADEYGQYAAGDQDVAQIAGDHDEAILRNTGGLRHSVSVLVESNQEPDVRNGPGEVVTQAEVNLRRVASQRQAVFDALRFLSDHADLVEVATDRAPNRAAAAGKRRAGAIYFGGADNEEPEEGQVVAPPPCAYRLSREQFGEVRLTLRLHAIDVIRKRSRVVVPMGQPARPVIPLLLDGRGSRHSLAATPLDTCSRARSS
ncbi:MAG: M14 family zinc carboxypeptidase [Actinomycetota bacterium]